MSMHWSTGSVRIRWRLPAISLGNCVGAERRAIGDFATLGRRSSVAAQHRLSAKKPTLVFVALPAASNWRQTPIVVMNVSQSRAQP